MYYMSNVLFTKKLISQLTDVIRTFWWPGNRNTTIGKSLCIRAWKDIRHSKDEGGLDIRNLQAINESLILSSAWRFANSPDSQLYYVLKSKYFYDTSILKAGKVFQNLDSGLQSSK